MSTPICDNLYLKLIRLPLIIVALLFSCQPDDPELSSDKSITSFSILAIDNPSLSADVHGIITGDDIHCIFPSGVSLTSLKPTIVHNGGSISPASGATTDFTSLLNFTVTAEDKSTQTYLISVTVTPPLSTDKTITSFSFLKADNPTLKGDVQGTISGQNISCIVPSGVSLTALKPTILHTGSSINPASTTANNFTTPATYTVTAEDATTSDYTVTVSIQTGPSVYVLGSQTISSSNHVRVWKDGIGTSITNGTYNAVGLSIFVKDNTQYIAGYLSIGRHLATYWKIENGIELSTPNLGETVNDSYAHSIYVSDNNDVYVAGKENHGASTGIIAKVWKNGTATSLTSKSGSANSVFVSGNDVYVAGYEETTLGYVAKVWKNGVAATLTLDDGKAQGKAVFVSDGVVYVAGQYWNGSVWVMKVWKNGTPETIDNAGSVEVLGMFVSSGDVYIVGTEKRADEQTAAKIWKNSIGTFLSEIPSSVASSVYVYNDDVYVAGQETNSEGKKVAMLWKNGAGTSLATDAVALSVMVK